MVEYILVFLLLFAATVAIYLLYERYVKRPPQPSSALYVQALRDLLDGHKVKAFGKLRQVVAEDYNNIDAYLRLGQILRDNNKPDRALQVHKDLTLRTTLTVEEKTAILQQLAEDYLALKDLDMAEAAMRELISMDNQNRWAHIKLLRLQEAAHKWDEAYDTAAHILKLENNKSKKPLAYYKYRQAGDLYKQREYHKARILYKEAIGLDPAYVAAYLAIGDSYCEEERFEDAISFWKKLIEAVPEKGHFVIDRLKRTLFDLGRYGELADICNSILAHDARNIEARLTLAEFYDKKGDTDAAQELLQQVVDAAPDNMRSVIDLLRILIEKGDRRRIAELFRTLERRMDKQRTEAVNPSPDSALVSAP